MKAQELEVQWIADFNSALQKGLLCIHPTDTIPGIGWDPRNARAWEALVRWKRRPPDKTVLGLVDSVEKAQSFWQPLPKKWSRVLNSVWPAPLSVVWSAAEAAPKILVSPQGEIGLRVPKLDQRNEWFGRFLSHYPDPFPTTSINIAGQIPLTSLEEISAALAGDPASFISKGLLESCLPTEGTSEIRQPSTLIRIKRDGDFEVLRPGALEVEIIHCLLTQS
jgi:L-threonylcarbamoyladenylate synthase